MQTAAMGKRRFLRRPGSVLAPALMALALLAAACGSDEDSEEPAPATTEAEAEAPAAEAEEEGSDEQAGKPERKPKPKGITIELADSQFGEVLFDEDRRAIYIFDKEQTSESECYGDCAVAWPPVLTKGEPQAKGDVRSGKLGTTKRDDGKTQVTYGGQPLYYYVDDPEGVVACHNVPGFGGLWLAIDAAGRPV